MLLTKVSIVTTILLFIALSQFEERLTGVTIVYHQLKKLDESIERNEVSFEKAIQLRDFNVAADGYLLHMKQELSLLK